MLESNNFDPQDSTSAASSGSSSPGISGPSSPASNRSSPSSSSSETPPRKFRSLQDIYESTEEIHESCTFAFLVLDPISYKEATKENEWCKAMEEELLSIEKNSTWDSVNLPKGKKAIELKWVFRTKYHADGSIQKHKARLVTKGYSQQQGLDFEETFSVFALKLLELF